MRRAGKTAVQATAAAHDEWVEHVIELSRLDFREVAPLMQRTAWYQANIEGKTLIVHNHAGGRTHCAPIHAPKGFLGVGDFTACPPAAEVGCPLGVALSMPVECLGDDGSWLG